MFPYIKLWTKRNKFVYIACCYGSIGDDMYRTDFGSTTLGYSHSHENHDYHHVFLVSPNFNKLTVLELYAREEEEEDEEGYLVYTWRDAEGNAINPLKTSLDEFTLIKEVEKDKKTIIRAAIYKEIDNETRSYGPLHEGNPGCFPFRYYEDYLVVANEQVYLKFKNKIREMRNLEKKRLRKLGRQLGLI